jgi:hypothetical protein
VLSATSSKPGTASWASKATEEGEQFGPAERSRIHRLRDQRSTPSVTSAAYVAA